MHLKHFFCHYCCSKRWRLDLSWLEYWSSSSTFTWSSPQESHSIICSRWSEAIFDGRIDRSAVSTVISFTENAACQWERLHSQVSGGQIWPEHNNVSFNGMDKSLNTLWNGNVFHGYAGISILFHVFLVNLSPTSFCAKRASSRLGRTYFYGWHRPQSFPSTSWYWQCACCPPCRPFTDDSGAVRRLIDWASAAFVTWLQAAERVPAISQWRAFENLPQTGRWTNRRSARGHLSCFPHAAVWWPDSAVWWVGEHFSIIFRSILQW